MLQRQFALDDIVNPRTGKVLYVKGAFLGIPELDNISRKGITFVPTLTIIGVLEGYSNEDISDIINQRYEVCTPPL